MKKIIALLLTLSLGLALVACGEKKNEGQNSKKESKTEEQKSEDKNGEDKIIKIGATPKPHAEILEKVKPILEKAGYELQIIEFDDYILPNTALEEGEIDANYFQHTTYMNNFNQTNGTHMVAAAKIHYEPLAVYGGKIKSLDELREGAQIAIPNDDTNGGRAILLLSDLNLITLKENAGLKPTEDDIIDNPKKLKFIPTEARLIPTVLSDVELGIINGNYAIDAGIVISDALAKESTGSIAEEAYANIVAVKEGNENSEKIKALIAAISSDEISAFINETYGGAVKPLF